MSQLHQPSKNCIVYFVGAAETAAPPGRHQPRRTAPTALTIRGYVGVRGYGRDAIPSYNSSP